MDLDLTNIKSETFSLPVKTKKLISKMLKEEISLNFTKFISPYILSEKQKNFLKNIYKKFQKNLFLVLTKKKV